MQNYHVLQQLLQTLVYVDVNRKGKHKERNHKKEEPVKSFELEPPDAEYESSDMIEDTQPVDEENIYISDQEEEQRGCYVISPVCLSALKSEVIGSVFS